MKKRPIAVFAVLVLAVLSLCGCRGNNQTPEQRFSGALEKICPQITEAFFPGEAEKLVKELDNLDVEVKYSDDSALKLVGSDFEADVLYGKAENILRADMRFVREGVLYANPKIAVKDGMLVIDWGALVERYGIDLNTSKLSEIMPFDEDLYNPGFLSAVDGIKKLVLCTEKLEEVFDTVRRTASVAESKDREDCTMEAAVGEKGLKEIAEKLGLDATAFDGARLTADLLLSDSNEISALSMKITGYAVNGNAELKNGKLSFEMAVRNAKLSVESDGNVTSAALVTDEGAVVSLEFVRKSEKTEFGVSLDGGEIFVEFGGSASFASDRITVAFDGLTIGKIGVRVTPKIGLSLTVKKAATPPLGELGEYKDVASVEKEELEKLKESLSGLIDATEIQSDEGTVTWPQTRINGEIPTPDKGYISSINDTGRRIDIIYRRVTGKNKAEKYANMLKEAGYSSEKNAEEGAPSGSFDFSYFASNDENGWSAGVYYNEYYHEMTVVAVIPEDDIVGFDWPNNENTTHLPVPNLGKLSELMVTNGSTVAHYQHATAQSVLDYANKLKKQGYKKVVSTEYDNSGEYVYSAENDIGYTAVIYASAVGGNDALYNACVVVIAPINLPDELPDFPFGKQASKREQDGVYTLAYKKTTEEDAKKYAETLKENGFVLPMDLEPISNEKYEYCYGAYNSSGFGVCVYYQGDGITCIMSGHFSF